jgi:chemotaxis protein MotB
MTKKSLHLACTALAAAFVMSGCVTKTTYEKLETEKNQEIALLQAERQALQKQRTELQKQIEDLDSQRATLEQNKAWLEQDQIGLQTRIGLLAQERGNLEKEKISLEQQKKALEEQKNSLEAQRAELQKQVDTLEQQKTQLLAASQETQSQYDSLVRNLTEEVQKGQLQVRRYKNMLTVDVAEQLFFDSGQAALKASGKAVLKKVGDTLKSYDDKVIRIVGHTDNVPIAKSLQNVFPSNWELSVARATTVVRYLQEVGIPPERMIASGRAEYAPVAANDGAEGRKKNRRIEITLIDRSLAEEVSQAAK